MLTQIQPMIGNRVPRIIRKGEIKCSANKIGHISENSFGKDSKIYTYDKYGPSAVLCRKKYIWALKRFYRNFRFFSSVRYR